MSRPMINTVADVWCGGQLQVVRCQKLKMDFSGSKVVVGMKTARLLKQKGASTEAVTKYRKMKISLNLGTLDMHMWQNHRERARNSNEIISKINGDRRRLSELVGALKADDAEAFLDVFKENKRPLKDVLQEIQISGDWLIHIAARHEAADVLDLICQACPPLLTAKNSVGDTVWHVVASEGLSYLFRQLRAFRQQQLLTPATYQNWKSSQHLRLNSLNNRGNTALHAALISGNESISDELFEMATDREPSWCYFSPNKEGKSVIYLAAEAGYVNLLRRMMAVAAAQAGNISETLKGKSLVHGAISGKQLASLDVLMEVAPELFDWRDEEGKTLLQWAASSGEHLEAAEYMAAKLGSRKSHY